MTLHSLARWFPFLKWPRPDRQLLKGEFWAGMTVGLMLVPQGVAYAALAGIPGSWVRERECYVEI